jgi:hypothetical protein
MWLEVVRFIGIFGYIVSVRAGIPQFRSLFLG